jgi:hypothetical protein
LFTRAAVWLVAAAAVLAVAALAAGELQRSTVAPSSKSAGSFPAPARTGVATVWAVGDGADGSSTAEGVAQLVERDPPSRLLYLGDVYESGTADEFRRNYDPLYGALRHDTAPTPGNHDWPTHAEGYDRYWAQVTGRRPPSFYAFDLAGWRIISLNSEEPLDGQTAQLRWLQRQVRGEGTCRLAFWHRPRYSAGGHGDQTDVDPLWSAVFNRATLVINGHEHNMQQMRPRGATTALIAGAGGHGHYSLNDDDPRLEWSDDTENGALRLVLRPGSASFSFVASDGEILRDGEVRCAQS